MSIPGLAGPPIMQYFTRFYMKYISYGGIPEARKW
jgi:hypothetical protein